MSEDILRAEGFVDKKYDNESAKGRKWQAVILRDGKRFHYWGGQEVKPGNYVVLEYKETKDKYPRLEKLSITDPPEEQQAEEEQKASGSATGYQPFEVAKTKMHAMNLSRDMMMAALEITPRGEDGSLDEEKYKGLMDFLQRDLFERTERISNYSMGLDEEKDT